MTYEKLYSAIGEKNGKNKKNFGEKRYEREYDMDKL